MEEEEEEEGKREGREGEGGGERGTSLHSSILLLNQRVKKSISGRESMFLLHQICGLVYLVCRFVFCCILPMEGEGGGRRRSRREKLKVEGRWKGRKRVGRRRELRQEGRGDVD